MALHTDLSASEVECKIECFRKLISKMLRELSSDLWNLGIYWSIGYILFYVRVCVVVAKEQLSRKGKK